LKVKDGEGNSESTEDNTTVFDLGIALVFDVSSKNKIAVAPSLSFGEDNTSLGLDFSFILPTN